MGYALASVLGCECHLGAEWIVDRVHIDWDSIELVITGEGRFDSQSSCGKVVDILYRHAAEHSIPTLVMAGTVEKHLPDRHLFTLVDCSVYEPDAVLTPEVARRRLEMAVEKSC